MSSSKPGGIQYLVLLRGINVGGKNLVKMEALRTAFEELDLDDVKTYIASGNVLFRAPRQKTAELSKRIESKLKRSFGTELKVVLVTESQLRAAVEGAPSGFGAKTHHCDVIFVRPPLTAKKALAAFEMKEGVDEASAGKGVVYFSRLTAKRTSSRMGRIAAKPEYKELTIRSWNTAKKLLDLVDERAAG